MITHPSAVLFDLDGTLLDTADDLAHCLNLLLTEESVENKPHSEIRLHVSNGANAMLTFAFGEMEQNLALRRRERLLALYQMNIAQHTRWFDDLERLTRELKSKQIPWGIVTNKPRLYTDLLLVAMGIDRQVDVVVCPDDLNIAKPDPRPLLHACKQVSADPAQAIYIGDHIRDIDAGRAAGMTTIAAAYGYLEHADDVNSWQADHIVQNSHDIASLIRF